MRKNANVKCAKTNYQNKRADDCLPLLRPCLFNIAEDPCEMFNLAERFDELKCENLYFDDPQHSFRYPNILNTMLELLHAYNSTAVPPANVELDFRGDPRRWNNVWTNFGDYE